MHVTPGKHVWQTFLQRGIETAAGIKAGRIFVGAEQPVPPYDIAIVVAVAAMLMVDAMHFGTLDKVANPARGTYAGMVEEFAQRRAQGVDRASLR